MKSGDIQKIREAGLITEEQHQAIVAHFGLERESHRLLWILGMIGGVLISAGAILIVASNWDDISHWVKLGAALALLVGTHAAGWQAGRRGGSRVLAETLHFLGSGMFLANIALVGQIYHMSSRPPNAILLWLLGVAPMAWILRSKAQHVLALCIFGLWFGMELNEPASPLYFGGDVRQSAMFGLMGILFAGAGLLLRRSAFSDFGGPTEKFGLLALHIGSFPMTVSHYYRSHAVLPGAWVVFGVLAAVTGAVWLLAVPRVRFMADRQWTWVWISAQVGAMLLMAFGLEAALGDTVRGFGSLAGPHWVAAPVLFGYCLLQIQVGLLRQNAWMVNLAVVFVGIHTFAAYINLFGSMQTTGSMFMVTGVLLVVLAYYLEGKRRRLIRRIGEHPAT